MTRLAVLALVAACGDNYSLQIVAEQPEGYKELITKTVVTVYETELDTLTCAQVEFGDVTDAFLLGAAVAQQTVMRNGDVIGTLDDISRVGRKVIVARMYGDNDVLIAAGCSETDDIDGDEKVTVPTIVAATVAVNAIDPDDPYGKSVTIVDPRGASIEARPVRWRLFAPGAATPASTAGVTIDQAEPTIWDSASPVCTTRSGIATMRLVPPAKVSGFAARFRVSWPASPIDVISGFVRPGLGVRGLMDSTTANRCAIRTVGERRVVCLQDVTTSPHAERYQLMPGPMNNYLLTETLPRAPIGGARPIGVVAVDEAAGKEVYAVLADGNIARLFGATTPAPVTCSNCAIDDARAIPACGNDPARIVMHSTNASGAPIRIVNATGGMTNDFRLPDDVGSLAVSLNSAGCVTTISLTGEERDVQIVVLDFSSAEGRATRGVFRCGPGAASVCSVPLPFPEAGVGFLKAGTATKPEIQLVGASLDVNGAEVIGWVLRATMDGFVLIDRQRVQAAGPPTQLLIGRLDGDMEPDIVWNIRGGRSSLLQVAYAHELPDGARLSALAAIGNVVVDEMLLGDLNGDGFDDLVGVGQSGFIALPQNVDGPPVMDRTTESPTCGP